MQTDRKHTKRFDKAEGSFTLEPSKKFDIDRLLKIFGMDILGKPDSYTIQYSRIVQARKHKKKRINKKWIKRYGYKQNWFNSKGWKLKCYKDGIVELVK